MVGETFKVGRVCHQPAKVGANPLLTVNHGISKGAPFSVFLDGEDFRMWYSAWRVRGPLSQRFAGIAFATSNNGVEWELPDLTVAHPADWPTTNMVLYQPFPRGIYNPVVLPLPSRLQNHGRFILFYYCTGTKSSPRGVYAATSEDGIRWFSYCEQPIWQTPCDFLGEELGFGTGDDVVTGFFDSGTDEFIVYRRVMHNEHPVYRPEFDRAYKPNINNFLRVQARATSIDGIVWKDHCIVYSPDLDDDWDVEYYGLNVFPYANCNLGFLTLYHTDTLKLDIHLRYSYDGLIWKRASNLPFIPCGSAGDFDQHIAWFACSPIPIGDELLIYYGGCDYPHSLEDEHWGNASIGLARLRKDGFVSLYSTKSDAHITTKALRLDFSKLWVNADARHGKIEVEVLDSDGNVISGFHRSASRVNMLVRPFHRALGQSEGGDSVCAPVSWDSGCALEELRDREVKFRFFIQHCHLYSFTLSDQHYFQDHEG